MSLPTTRPALTMKTLEGRLLTLKDFQGQVLLLDVWATWCPPCLEDIPELQALHKKYRAKGFSVVGVSLDEEGASAVRPLLTRNKISYPMLLDTSGKSSTRAVLDITTLPSLFLMDAKGVIIGHWTGRTNKDEIEAAIISALGTAK